MDIHFISTLTPEDEDAYAPAVLRAVKAILELMPIAYTLRIETTNGRVVQHTRSDVAPQDGVADQDEDRRFVPGRVVFSA